ncbi:hypothetical protein ONA00_02025 [Mycoplasmopsis cynos]|uniref:hypothetical protein n=1 Tax=Mycoplasmopsis cynos TaxID=171284 RepID=UPI0024C8394B|nr:hypothetical protein [Mycoplasmopsis cynos]WAM11249.1 hypothetical protein ONA00_02025 [Mycoplasmopsis cynos]
MIDYINKIKSLNGKISMSRIGNSLDNREIEYFSQYSKAKFFLTFPWNVDKWILMNYHTKSVNL